MRLRSPGTFLDEQHPSNDGAEASERCSGIEHARVGGAGAGATTGPTTGSRWVAFWVGLASDTSVGSSDDVRGVSLVELVADGTVGAGGLDVGATSNNVDLGQNNPA